MYSFWIKSANVNIVVYGNLMVESNLQPHQSTHNNVCKQYVYVCIYGNGMYLLLQWWLQVLTCIIILDYWLQWQFEEGG